MRISVDPLDESYANSRNVIHRVQQVLFNGYPVCGCMTADEEKGLLITYKKDSEGNYEHDDDGRRLTNTYFGKIEIVIEEPTLEYAGDMVQTNVKVASEGDVKLKFNRSNYLTTERMKQIQDLIQTGIYGRTGNSDKD